MRASVVLLSLALASVAAEREKPRCTAANQGEFWPEQANHDARIRRAAAQSGELEICSAYAVWTWRYRWQRATIGVRRPPEKQASKQQHGVADSSAN
jgi:hypothetical protein